MRRGKLCRFLLTHADPEGVFDVDDEAMLPAKKASALAKAGTVEILRAPRRPKAKPADDDPGGQDDGDAGDPAEENDGRPPATDDGGGPPRRRRKPPIGGGE